MRSRLFLSRARRGLLSLVLWSGFTAFGQVSPLTPFVPNDPLFAPNLAQSFPGQWYLANRAPATMQFSYTFSGQVVTSTVTNNTSIDANLSGAWARGYTGKGVVIGIVGTSGVQGTQPDLAPNYRADLSRNFSQNPAIASQPQGPLTANDNQDTAVAGIAAARGGNAIGITGTAPLASLAGLHLDGLTSTGNWAENQNYVDANYFASGVSSVGIITGYADVGIRNRSYARSTPFGAEDPRVIKSLNDTANNEVINIFAAGDFRGTPAGDTNRIQANSLASGIAVAALGSDGKFADYSNYGTSIFVTAPSARLDNTGLRPPTTDRTGTDGFNPGTIIGDQFPDRNYTTLFSGTAAAAPIVSGIVALGKELDPFLDARMVQQALATTSKVVDASDASGTGRWQTNGAGLHFNADYGFGLVDATAFLNKVEQIAFVTAPQAYSTGTIAVPLANRTVTTAGRTESIAIGTANLASAGVNRLPLESVEIALDLTSPDRTALQGTLTSPAGTTSTFMSATNLLTGLQPVFDDPTPAAGLHWTFLANNFWGEDPVGNWSLNVSQRDTRTSTWNSYALTFHLGQMVLESGSLTISSNTTANSVQIDSAATNMSIAGNTTFSVRDEVWVNNGRLDVDGRLQNMAGTGLARSRLRLNGGQLTGTGTIALSLGVLNSAGTVRPGTAGVIGTLTIEGNYTQEAAGTLEVDIGSNTQADALVVRNGNVALGGTLRIKPLSGANIVAGSITPIIRVESGGRITGAFQTIDGLRVRPTLALRRASSADTLYSLEAYRDYLVADVSATFTTADRELATYLNEQGATTNGSFEEMLRAIDAQGTAADAAHAITAVGPFTSSLAPSLALATDAARVDAVLRRIRVDPPGKTAVSGFFVDTSFAHSTVDATDRRPAYDFDDRGIVAGYDRRFTPEASGGFFFGTSTSSGSVNATGSTLDGSHRGFGVHATWEFGQVHATAASGYGWGNFDRTRVVNFPGTAERLTSNSDTHQHTLALEVGDSFGNADWHHQVFGNVRFQNANIAGYTETGPFGWQVGSQSVSSSVLTAGYELARVLALDQTQFTPFASLNLMHEFQSGDYDLGARLPGDTGGGLVTQTERADRDYAALQAGATFGFTNRVQLYGAVKLDFGRSDSSRYAFNFGIWRRF